MGGLGGQEQADQHGNGQDGEERKHKLEQPVRGREPKGCHENDDCSYGETDTQSDRQAEDVWDECGIGWQECDEQHETNRRDKNDLAPPFHSAVRLKHSFDHGGEGQPVPGRGQSGRNGLR